jgi:hypothetical protein
MLENYVLVTIRQALACRLHPNFSCLSVPLHCVFYTECEVQPMGDTYVELPCLYGAQC